jgi:hypothetical protein|tara:strand:- start:769 stop:945 length:177 start_codon:yes stop_codon:yes gene_type:complete
MFKDYQLEIIERALQVFVTNYDDYDLEDLLYSSQELESEVHNLQERIETHFLKEGERL